MTQYIGLGHYSRTGKSTLANALVGYLKALPKPVSAKQVPFAWKLKQVAHDLYAWAGVKAPRHYETPEGEKDRDIIIPALGMTPVELWVKLGTPAIRENVYDMTWVDYVLKNDHDCDVIAIGDVRFPNEIKALREKDAILIKVVRPGYGPRNTVADLALQDYDGWDYVVGSSGLMDELRYFAHRLASWIGGIGPKPIQTEEERQHALSVEKKLK